MNMKTGSLSVKESLGLTVDFAHLYHLLLRKSWLIILCIVLTLLAAIAYLTWTPKIYESRATIQVEQEASKIIKIEDINPEDFRSSEDLKTVEQSLLSDTLLLRVVKANGLDKDPSFAPPKADASTYLNTQLTPTLLTKLPLSLP